MKKLLTLSFIFILLACNEPKSFGSRVQFLIPMTSEGWPHALNKIEKLVSNDIYIGSAGEIVSIPGASRSLYLEKVSKNGNFKIIAVQREGKPHLSVILYVLDNCSDCGDWQIEATRIEKILRQQFNEMDVNYGPITEIPL